MQKYSSYYIHILHIADIPLSVFYPYLCVARSLPIRQTSPNHPCVLPSQ